MGPEKVALTAAILGGISLVTFLLSGIADTFLDHKLAEITTFVCIVFAVLATATGAAAGFWAVWS